MLKTVALVLLLAILSPGPAAARAPDPQTLAVAAEQALSEHESLARDEPRNPDAERDLDFRETAFFTPGSAEPGNAPLDALEAPRAGERQSSGSSGGPAMGGPGGGFMGGGGPPGYEATWYPSRSIDGQPGDFELFRQGLRVGGPIWRNDTDIVISSIGVRNSLFETDAILPDSLQPFPEQLWGVNFGLSYMHQLDNGWSSGLITGFGSASDEPFHSIDELTATLGGFFKIPVRDHRDAWMLGAIYLYGGPADFPFPIIAYAWNPSDELNVNLGVPFSVMWRPDAHVTFNLSYMPLATINSKINYQLTERLQLFAGYEYLNESYFLAGRTDVAERFFSLEQRVVAGGRWDLGRFMRCEVSGGYSFDRHFGQGQSQWDSLSDRVDIEAGLFVSAGLGFRF